MAYQICPSRGYVAGVHALFSRDDALQFGDMFEENSGVVRSATQPALEATYISERCSCNFASTCDWQVGLTKPRPLSTTGFSSAKREEETGDKSGMGRFAPVRNSESICAKLRPRVMQLLVSYSFYEKDEGQRRNFEYFITAGMKVLNGRQSALPAGVDFGIIISGHLCTPCAALQGLVHERRLLLDGVAATWDSRRIAILHRSENTGMDFAAHNVSAASSCLCRNNLSA